jgi:hypothetical protein
MGSGDFVEAEGSRACPPDRARRADLISILHFKRNSGGCVIFDWNCARQLVTSQASHISALRQIGK